MDKRDRAYRFYITEALRAIGGLNVRYADIIEDNPVVNNRSPENIINNLSKKLDDMRRN